MLSDETDDEPEVHCTPNRDDIRGICLIRLGELNAPSHCLLACCVDGQAALGLGFAKCGEFRWILSSFRMRGQCLVMRQMTSLKCIAHQIVMIYEAFV